MIKLEIIKKDNYVYELKDQDENQYTLNLEFFDIQNEIKVGDYIQISAELLKPKYSGYSTSYTFGSLESKYGKNNIRLDDIDVIKVITEEKEIYLKRLYG